MKQTSAEWLFSNLWNTTKDKFTWYAILEQAKEMEKQQIIDAHISGYDSSGESANDYYDFYYGSKGSDDSPKVENKDSFGEISDEEIEDVAWEKFITDSGRFWFISGAKWYREQLKQRQC